MSAYFDGVGSSFTDQNKNSFYQNATDLVEIKREKLFILRRTLLLSPSHLRFHLQCWSYCGVSQARSYFASTVLGLVTPLIT